MIFTGGALVLAFTLAGSCTRVQKQETLAGHEFLYVLKQNRNRPPSRGMATNALQLLSKVHIINENEEKTSLTAVIQNEDHTLGNSLRYILMRR
jgi:hypothetical protein